MNREREVVDMAETMKGIFSRILQMKRTVACAVLLSLTPFFTGCYGAFPLTKAIYRANGQIDNVILKNVVFWAFIIVPVYGIGALADAVVFNLIDFWSGKKIHISSATDEHGNLFVLTPSADGRGAVLTVSCDGRVLSEVSFVRTSDTVCDVRGADGALLGQALRTAQGGIQLTDAKGILVTSINPDDLREGRPAELALQLAR